MGCGQPPLLPSAQHFFPLGRPRILAVVGEHERLKHQDIVVVFIPSPLLLFSPTPTKIQRTRLPVSLACYGENPQKGVCGALLQRLALPPPRQALYPQPLAGKPDPTPASQWAPHTHTGLTSAGAGANAQAASSQSAPPGLEDITRVTSSRSAPSTSKDHPARPKGPEATQHWPGRAQPLVGGGEPCAHAGCGNTYWCGSPQLRQPPEARHAPGTGAKRRVRSAEEG